MMGRQVSQGSLFYGFRLEDHIPADHLLRRIDGLLDFGFVREALSGSYSVAGRPSIDPELMLRMPLPTTSNCLPTGRHQPEQRGALAHSLPMPVAASAANRTAFFNSLGRL